MLSKYNHFWSVASWLCLTAFGGLKARRGTEAGGDLLDHSLLGDAMCSCWSLLVLLACQNSPGKIGELETSRGTSTKMKCYIIRVNYLSWILQFPLDLKSIPVLWFHEIYCTALLLSAPALFFSWSVTINVIWFDYISIALLVTGASTKWIQQPKANFHRYAIRFFRPYL